MIYLYYISANFTIIADWDQRLTRSSSRYMRSIREYDCSLTDTPISTLLPSDFFAKLLIQGRETRTLHLRIKQTEFVIQIYDIAPCQKTNEEVDCLMIITNFEEFFVEIYAATIEESRLMNQIAGHRRN